MSNGHLCSAGTYRNSADMLCREDERKTGFVGECDMVRQSMATYFPPQTPNLCPYRQAP